MNLKESPFEELLIIQDVLGPISAEELRTLPKPKRCCGRIVPENMNHLSIGELLYLRESALGGAESLLSSIGEVILRGVTLGALLKEKALFVQGLLNWFTEEIERINALFASAGRQLTDQEIRAGFGNSSSGGFALIDWYARRMGITSHEEAERTPWPRVYKCLELDNENEEKNRRLAAIREAENKSKRK